jgi:hypothetical protein
MLDRPTDGGVASLNAGFPGIVTSISGVGSAAVYAVGPHTKGSLFGDPEPADNIWRYVPPSNGSEPSWEPVSPPCDSAGPGECRNYNAVWVQSAQVQWFAAPDGKVFRTGSADAGSSDGGSGAARLNLVEVDSSSVRALNALWGFGENDLWAVGSQGVTRHWAGGAAWTIVPSPVSEDLRGVWGSRPDDVWAVGDHATVLHWDGKVWTVVDVPFPESNRPRLYAVSGSGTDVWMVGEGSVLRVSSAKEGGP